MRDAASRNSGSVVSSECIQAVIRTDGDKVRSRTAMLVVCAGVEALRFEARPRVGLEVHNTSTPPGSGHSDMI